MEHHGGPGDPKTSSFVAWLADPDKNGGGALVNVLSVVSWFNVPMQGSMVMPILSYRAADQAMHITREDLRCVLDRLTATQLHVRAGGEHRLPAQLADGGFEKVNTTRLKPYLERMAFKQGDHLICQGEEANALYFIEIGSVSVYLQIENGEKVRLQTSGLGTAVGELDLYQGCPSTASVIADSPGIAYRLTRAALLSMKANDPELSATFHEFITHLLSERLAAATRTLEAVIR